MSAANKLPLVKDAMRMMIERLGEKDRVAMVVYAGAAGCVLEGTPGNQQSTILSALDRLQAGGSTNGGQGIQLAYQMARDQFIPGAITGSCFAPMVTLMLESPIRVSWSIWLPRMLRARSS